MMHDREKSHSAIVAAKPTNNALASKADVAEPVEPRAGTKRKAEGQSTLRTQGRERVSQALDRLRKAAGQKKKEKFTALFHHLSIDMLRELFFALKREAAPGRGWADMDGLCARPWSQNCKICTQGSNGERIGRNHHAGRTYRRRTENSARWRSRHWRTKSSKGRPWRC